MNMKKFFAVLLVSGIWYLASVCYAANVKVRGRQLFVDGQLFTVKGVNYGYTPVGEGYMKYDWTVHPEFYKKDFELIRAMGANTIRLHGLPSTSAVLDAAYEYGLYVILNIPVTWGGDLSSETVREQVKKDVETYVTQWKNHPALLLWLLGNEVNYWNIDYYHATSNKRYWYTLLNECAQLAHTIEGVNYHPFTSAEAEIFDLANAANQSDDAHMTDVDVWAAQVYRGPYMDGIFSYYSIRSSKPLIFTEYGTDAYNTKENREDAANQASMLLQQLTSINNNLSAPDPVKVPPLPAGVCIGGCIFQWADDWSKNQWGSPNSVHNTNGTWSNSNYYDFEDSSKNNMNEEWWGLVAIAPDTDEKTPRAAYYTVKNLWQPNEIGKADDTEMFLTEVRNFPNPFKPGEIPTQISFAVAPSTSVSAKIYDSIGNLVKVLEDGTAPDMYTEYTLLWDGKDENNQIVGNGVYICYVRASGPRGMETRYRKIVVLK